MTLAAFGGASFSSVVDIWLEVEGYRDEGIPLSQAGADFVTVSEPVSIPAGPAVVVVSVDGCLYRNRVYMVRGIVPDNPKVMVSACCSDNIPF